MCASDLFVTQYTSNISYLGLYPPDQRHVWHSLVYLEWFGMIKAQAIGLLQYVHHSVVFMAVGVSVGVREEENVLKTNILFLV